MASQILSGTSNPSYTNNTGQNVRIIINFMYSSPTDEIVINWAGQSIGENGIEAIGKNIAAASGWYGDFFNQPWTYWGWWRIGSVRGAPLPSTSNTILNSQNVTVKLPQREIDVTNWRRGWWWWYQDTTSKNITGFAISIALPLEIFLAPGQTFSAICGSYNILVMKEDGN